MLLKYNRQIRLLIIAKRKKSDKEGAFGQVQRKIGCIGKG
jgi:hypothetical protein